MAAVAVAGAASLPSCGCLNCLLSWAVTRRKCCKLRPWSQPCGAPCPADHYNNNSGLNNNRCSRLMQYQPCLACIA